MVSDHSVSHEIGESFSVEFEMCGFDMYSVTVHVCEHLDCVEAVGFREWSDHVCCNLLPWLFGDVVRIKGRI